MDSDEREHVPDDATPGTARPAAIRVLLVDDHQTVLWGLQQLIDSHSPKMAVAGTASNATDAASLAERLQPDLILLDADLGGDSGIDLIPTLRAKTNASILMLTGVRDRDELDRAVLAGARGVVRKEDPADRLLLAIEKVHAGELWLDRDATTRIFQALQERNRENDEKASRLQSLTRRELDIVKAVVAESGASNKVIARKLFMSEHTLRNHLTAIYHKLGVDNRLKLFVFAMENGLGERDK